MIGRSARRAIEALVALFAVLGFCFVPLGQKTALEHVAAILRTDAAAQAARGMVEAAERARRRIFAEAAAAPSSSAPLSRSELLDGGAPAVDASLPWASGHAMNDDRVARAERR